MNAEDFRTLFQFNAWANHRTMGACDSVGAESFATRLTGSFPSVRDTLVHIMAVERLWLERWLGTSDGSFLKPESFPDIGSVRAEWARIERELLAFVNGLTEEHVNRIIPHKNSQGTEFRMPLWQLMQHLVNHGTYHRGQITNQLREVGGKPLGTDLVTFYRERDAAK
jgi:uncharacterized damage-inducible protein DinB